MMFYKKFFLLSALMLVLLAPSLSAALGVDAALASYKAHAKEHEFIVEPRTLAILGTVGLAISTVSAYRSMKQGYFVQAFEEQKEKIAGHEEILHSVRQKIIDLLKINPANKLDLEELKAEESLLLDEIRKIKEKSREWSLLEIIRSQGFKHLSAKDFLRGFGSMFGLMVAAEIGFKGFQLALRANDTKAADGSLKADILWKEVYEGQENIYGEMVKVAKLLFEIAKMAGTTGFEIVKKHQPEKRGIIAGVGLSTFYTLRDARDSMQLRKAVAAEKFSYVDDMLLSPLQVLKEIGPFGALRWTLGSYVSAQAISKLFEIADLRKEINPPKP